MRVLHVNNVDLLGNRFNGHDMQIALNKRGIAASQVVMERMGDDPHTIPLAAGPHEPYLRRRLMECERELSLHGMIYPYLYRLMELPEFQKADVVHYHLLHNYFGSLPVLPEITAKKPSVLTIHDPWLFTGHCIYPLECSRWERGCGQCPHLDVNFPMREDRTALQWAVKREVLSRSKLDLIVASAYMLELVRRSPITREIEQVHLIPFGIDTTLFSAERDRREVRRRLSIPEENIVLSFRADPSRFKGFDCIKRMLDQLRVKEPVTLLAVGNPGMLSAYERRFQVIDLSWVTDNSLMADIYCASDIFLMPSTAEAFGLMAIEAMAAGRPVVVCEGTSLPGVTFAPECGVVVPQDDSEALCRAVTRLIGHPEERRARGEAGRRLAQENYQFDDYVNRHLAVYEDMLRRGQ